MNDNTQLADTSLDSATPAAEPLKAKRRPGRKEDTTGATNLGKARIIYANNPNLSIKELKQKFEAELLVGPQVAQTYASLVRRKKTTTV